MSVANVGVWVHHNHMQSVDIGWMALGAFVMLAIITAALFIAQYYDR